MTTDLDKAVGRQPFMPTCEISPDALVRVESGEVITWAECQRRLSSANARAKAAEEGLREMERRCAEYDRINLVGKTPGARRAGTLRNVLTIARTTLASMKEANHD